MNWGALQYAKGCLKLVARSARRPWTLRPCPTSGRGLLLAQSNLCTVGALKGHAVKNYLNVSSDPCPEVCFAAHPFVPIVLFRMRYAVVRPNRDNPKARRLLFVCVCGRANERVIDVAPKAA